MAPSSISPQPFPLNLISCLKRSQALVYKIGPEIGIPSSLFCLNQRKREGRTQGGSGGSGEPPFFKLMIFIASLTKIHNCNMCATHNLLTTQHMQNMRIVHHEYLKYLTYIFSAHVCMIYMQNMCPVHVFAFHLCCMYFSGIYPFMHLYMCAKYMFCGYMHVTCMLHTFILNIALF